jgi:hypothetical protein
MYAVVDTETCTCCDGMKHERIEREFDTQEDAVRYVLDHHNVEQLFEGLFDDVVIRHYGDAGNRDATVLQFVKDTGVMLADAHARRTQKHQTPCKTSAFSLGEK